jgi:hypothetical protein
VGRAETATTLARAVTKKEMRILVILRLEDGDIVTIIVGGRLIRTSSDRTPYIFSPF